MVGGWGGGGHEAHGANLVVDSPTKPSTLGKLKTIPSPSTKATKKKEHKAYAFKIVPTNQYR